MEEDCKTGKVVKSDLRRSDRVQINRVEHTSCPSQIELCLELFLRRFQVRFLSFSRSPKQGFILASPFSCEARTFPVRMQVQEGGFVLLLTSVSPLSLVEPA